MLLGIFDGGNVRRSGNGMDQLGETLCSKGCWGFGVQATEAI